MSYFRGFREVFIFSSKEKKGIYLFLVLISAAVVFNYTVHLWHPPTSVDYSELKAAIEKRQAELAALEQEEPGHHSSGSFKREKQSSDSQRGLTPFAFNPNELDEQGWQRLGFSEKEAATISKYTSKGGKFQRPEDLKKLYVMTDERYAILEPFIRIENKPNPIGVSVPTDNSESKERIEASRRTSLLIEINTADTTDLKKLRGIGSFYARKIVEYREKLGGYTGVEQLLEIWKFGEERLASIEDEILIDASFLRKLNANRATKEELKNHPYINHNLATMWVNYRQHHGPFKQPTDLKKLILMSDSLLYKLEPYLTFEP
jgi:competence protein ComEA